MRRRMVIPLLSWHAQVMWALLSMGQSDPHCHAVSHWHPVETAGGTPARPAPAALRAVPLAARWGPADQAGGPSADQAWTLV